MHSDVETDQLTKTGSGQTWIGYVEKKVVLCVQESVTLSKTRGGTPQAATTQPTLLASQIRLETSGGTSPGQSIATYVYKYVLSAAFTLPNHAPDFIQHFAPSFGFQLITYGHIMTLLGAGTIRS